MPQFFKFIRDLPSRTSPRWPWPLRKVREANIPAAERDLFERYGETVISMQVRGSFVEDAEHARAWLTERADYQERQGSITFALEIVVVVLIGGEILLALWQGHLQSRNFDDQQQVLTNLQTSSAATAKTLTSLQSATESMNTTLQMQLDALKKSEAQAERSAKAGEASASTASQAMHVSERAYVHMTAFLLKPPTAGERVHPIVSVTNMGHTPALDVANIFFFSLVPASTPIKTARDIASALPQSGPAHSLFTLPSGQTSTMQTDSQSPYLQSMVDQLTNGETVLYLFASASYKDVFNQLHHTEICGFYQPKSNNFGACAEYNKFD
jgi:hypothetical protein